MVSPIALAEVFEQIEARLLRHVKISDDNPVPAIPIQRLARRAAVTYGAHAVPATLQNFREQLAAFLVVINNQNLYEFHLPTLFAIYSG